MLIRDQLRLDVKESVNHFYQNKKKTLERQKNVTDIQRILSSKDPLRVRTQLVNYVNGLSTGFSSFLPFLEVNKLQAALKAVLGLPQYQETAFLKTLLQEVKEQQVPHKSQMEESILTRLSQLESEFRGQSEILSETRAQVLAL